ncbi:MULTISPECIES: flippase [Haloarcula]|uniref:flippase n=1 Tax=Haloarcula TaxID=2237 RepID=UPI0023E7ACC0|nr:flippase [Halomicroarcula sp. SHR3]
MAPITDELSTVFNSAVFVLFGGLLSKGIVLLEKLLIGRTFSVAQFGEINLAIAIFALGATVSSVGLTQGVPRYLPRSEDKKIQRGILFSSLIITGIIAILVSLILVVMTGFLQQALFDRAIPKLALWGFFICIPLFALLQVMVSGIRGLENTRYKVYVEDIFYPVSRLAFMWGLIVFGIGINSVWISYITALILAFVLSNSFSNKLLTLIGEYQPPSKELLTYSAPLMVSAVVATLLTKVDTFMLGAFTSSYEVGLYSAGYSIASSLLIILSSFGFIYLPIVSRLDVDDDSDVSTIYQVVSKWAYILTFPLFAVLIIHSHEILGLVLGNQYRAGGTALSLLSIGFMTHVAAGRNRETLSALGFPRYVLLSNLIVLLLNIVLNAFFIPLYGHIGAALASLLSFVAVTVVVYILLYYLADVTPISKRLIRIYVGLPVCILPIIWVLQALIPISVLSIFISAFVATVCTGVVVYLLNGLQKEDTAIIDAVESRTGISFDVLRSALREYMRI